MAELCTQEGKEIEMIFVKSPASYLYHSHLKRYFKTTAVLKAHGIPENIDQSNCEKDRGL